MEFKKCVRCQLDQKESNVAYTKRIRYDFDTPFICKDCIKMMSYDTKPTKYESPKKKKEEEKKLASIPYRMNKDKISYAEAKRLQEEGFKSLSFFGSDK